MSLNVLETRDATLVEDIDDTWIVIPAYMEETVIAQTIYDARSRFKNVVDVDDVSADATATVAFAACAHVIKHPINLGQGAALQTAIDYAVLKGARFIATFDADGQHTITDVVDMLKILRLGELDVVLGSRFIGAAVGISVARRLLLRAAIIFTRVTTGLTLTDAHNGLRVFTRAGIKKIELRQNRMAHASEILEQIAQQKLRYVEHGNTICYTAYSVAKGQRASNSVSILMDLFVGRLRK